MMVMMMMTTTARIPETRTMPRTLTWPPLLLLMELMLEATALQGGVHLRALDGILTRCTRCCHHHPLGL